MQTVVAVRTEVVAESNLVGSALAEAAGTAGEVSVPATGSPRTPAAAVHLVPVACG